MRSRSPGRGTAAPLLLVFMLALSAVAAACTGGNGSNGSDGSDPASRQAFIDSSGAEVAFDAPPQRIISYSPGVTEILFAIGAGDRMVATDDFSDYPAAALDLPRLAYINPDPEAALAHEPDLVVMASAQAAQVSQFRDLGMTVFSLEEPASIEGVYESITLLGEITGNDERAAALVEEMRARVDAVTAKIAGVERGPRVYFELDASLFTVAPQSFVGGLLEVLKANNVAEGAQTAFPQLTAEALIAADPEVVLLANAEFGESAESVAARPGWSSVSAVVSGRIFAVDPDTSNRPGPRIVDAIEEMAKLLYPDRFEQFGEFEERGEPKVQADEARTIAAAPAVYRRRGALARAGPVALAGGVLLAVAAFALTQGAASIPPATALGLLLERVPLVDLDLATPAAWERIVIDVRLPRVLAAAAVGGALAYSGAAYQGVFRNPLADPFLLGVAAGAALGASIAVVSPLDAGAYGFGWVPLLAFAGAAAAVLLASLVAQVGRTVSNTTLILAGVAISAIAGALTSFILLTAGEQSRPILAFLFGSFNTASWARLLAGAPYLLIGAAVVGVHARVLNVLQLDEEQAAQLGVDVARTRLIVLGGASLMAATAVAMAGVIGFVGLIVPHAVRMLFGADHRRLLPLAALLGAAFLIAADVLSRTALAPQEIPVGLVTAVTGAPFFLYLLRTRRADGLQ